jgi:hypothetical protein
MIEKSVGSFVNLKKIKRIIMAAQANCSAPHTGAAHRRQGARDPRRRALESLRGQHRDTIEHADGGYAEASRAVLRQAAIEEKVVRLPKVTSDDNLADIFHFDIYL